MQQQHLEAVRETSNSMCCGEPPKVENAIHDGNRTTPYLKNVRYTCKKGFRPRAERSVVKTCKGNGVWDGDDIMCDGKANTVGFSLSRSEA